MKTRITFAIVFLFTTISFAQQGINYKAIVKDGGGNVVASQNINIQFIIYKGTGETTNVYQETHSPNTDANGIVIVNIGEGTPDSGNYGAIDWGSDDHFLNVQINTGGGLTDLGTTQFMAVPYALQATKATNVTGLEALDEGNGIGWRLIGRDAGKHGNVGLDAVDLSYSPFSSTTRGATATYALATGYRTIANGGTSTAFGNTTTASGASSTAMGVLTQASGDYSIAMGYGSIASGETSTAMGFETTAGIYSTAMGELTTASGHTSTAMGSLTVAEGNVSTAMGSNTTASGIASTAMGYQTSAGNNYATAMGYNTSANGTYSTAIGNFTLASGYGSTAMGGYSIASGDYTTALGAGTYAKSSNSTAIGRYNIGGGSQFEWIGTDPLFEIGTGSGDDNRQNALTVLKNGNVGIGTATPSYPLHVTGSVGGINSSPAYYVHYLNGYGTNGSSWSYSIGAQSAIYSSVGFATGSDSRIKNILGQSNASEDLKSLLALEITNYTFKDHVKMGNRVSKKVIAQQIKTVMPNAVNLSTEFIPNIYELVDVEVVDANSASLTIDEPQELAVGDVLKLIPKDGGEQQATITNIVSNTIAVRTDTRNLGDEVFVYGKRVDDFHSVDYDAISMLNVSATQAQQLLIERQQEKIEQLQAKLKILSTLEDRVVRLESLLSNSHLINN